MNETKIITNIFLKKKLTNLIKYILGLEKTFLQKRQNMFLTIKMKKIRKNAHDVKKNLDGEICIVTNILMNGYVLHVMIFFLYILKDLNMIFF